jgi:Spy/CpxP family protein refolding chaperone
MVLAGLVAGGLATAGAAVPSEEGDPCRLANTPIGKLISGSIGRLMVLRSELNVTAEQKQQIREVLKSHRAEILATVKTVHEKRTALRDAVLAGKDESEVRAAANELGQVIADTAVKATKLRNQVAPILTEEQRKLIGKHIAAQDEAVGGFLEQAGSRS